LVIVAPLLLTLFTRTAVSLSQSNFGSAVRDDQFQTATSRLTANTDVSNCKVIESNGVAAGIVPKTESVAKSPPFRRGHWCDYCSVGFNKHKSYLEHVAGKRHKTVIAEGDLVWEEYVARGKDSVFWDASVTKMDVAKAWSLDSFAEGLRARGRSSKKKSVSRIGMVGTNDGSLSPPLHFTGNNGNVGGGNQIDPTLRLSDLPPSKRAALFRYLHATSSGIPCLPDMVEALPPKYVRIKELLESVEVYFQFRETILKRSTKQGKRPKRLKVVYDVGCGHGLVGMLIAASCPHIQVIAIDRVPRESFVAQKEAFDAAGTSLTNLEFENGDLSILRGMEEENDNTSHAMVLCVHGCKELTHESIELAREKDFAWLAIPCCLQKVDHLGEATALKVQSDHTRYAMLCGAIAANYQPETITTIDSRITGRGIVLASSGGG
jgi:SAM-dependent methyltransferase